MAQSIGGIAQDNRLWGDFCEGWSYDSAVSAIVVAPLQVVPPLIGKSVYRI